MICSSTPASREARRSASAARARSSCDPGAARRAAAGERCGLAASTASRHAREAPTTRRPVAAPAPRRATPPQARGVSRAGPSSQPGRSSDRDVSRPLPARPPALRRTALSSAPSRARPESPRRAGAPARGDAPLGPPDEAPEGRPVEPPDLPPRAADRPLPVPALESRPEGRPAAPERRSPLSGRPGRDPPRAAPEPPLEEEPDAGRPPRERDGSEAGGRGISTTYRAWWGSESEEAAREREKDPRGGPFHMRNPAASYSPRESPPKYHRRWWA